MAGLFTQKTISDQKRLVRGEQLLYARGSLRVRDHVHHAKWRVLTTSGMAPKGEIAALRELMPKCHITAVDYDPDCLAAAIEAGADEVVECDLAEFHIEESRITTRDWRGNPHEHVRTVKHPAKALCGLPKFDIVNLDLCGVVTENLKEMARLYRRLVEECGVFILTFAYGRDVTEVFYAELARRTVEIQRWFAAIGLSREIAGRLAYLFTDKQLNRVESIMLYRGNEMPMCSVLTHVCTRKNHVKDAVSVVRAEPGDFEIAVAHPDPALLYDCPQDRIESLRRKHAAAKAVHTRQLALVDQADLISP